MSNIKKIEVNGVEYGLESVTNFVVTPFEPTEAPLPELWLKPKRIYNFNSQIQLEKKPGSTEWQGNYTLDSEGNLVETTDTVTSITNFRATEMVDLFKNKQYKIATNYSTSFSYNFSWYVYFYNKNNEFISYVSGSVTSGEQLPINTTILDFELPEGAYKVRFLLPYQYGTNTSVAERDVVITQNGMYGENGNIEWYQLDGDHYVRL